MNELQNTLETLRTCLRMLTFCELVSSLILPMTNSASVRGEVKFGGAIFWTGFSSSIALVRFVCTLHVLSIGVLRTRGLRPRFALHVSCYKKTYCISLILTLIGLSV